jgi:hypothetical protein
MRKNGTRIFRTYKVEEKTMECEGRCEACGTE